MTTYWGDYPVGATIRIPFATFAGATGASITMTGFAAADVEIYKNGGTTQRSSDNGYTATTDFDSLTGLHMLVIDTSDNTDSGFFAAGNEYQVAISTVTIDSQTVSFWAGTFSIERSGGALALLKDGTYGLSALETLVDEIESRLTSTRAGYLDNLSAGAVALQSSVDDLESRLGTPSDLGSGASIAANLVDIEAQTDDIGTAGAGLSNVPWNASWDAQVESEVADALAVYDPPTNAELASEINSVQADIAALNDLSQAEIRSAVGLASNNLDTQLAALPTASENADAVWEEAIADHSGTSGSTAESLSAAGSAGDPWTTALPGAYGAGSAGNIVGNNLNATISSRASQASLDTLDDYVDTEIAAIKAKTDNLPSDPADSSDIAASFSTVNNTLSTIAAYIDTEVAAILAAVDTEIAAIKAKTDNLPASPAATGDIPSTTAIKTAIFAGLMQGRSYEEITMDIWAVVAGDALADDDTEPTSITYDSPDTTVQVTHTLTSTTRARS